VQVEELVRYPVKSLGGERLGEVALNAHGLEHDRRFALLDVETGYVASLKNPRRWRVLLQLQSRVTADGHVEIQGPTGATSTASPEAASRQLSSWCGRGVRLATPDPTDCPAVERLWPSVPGLVPDAVLDRARAGSPQRWPITANQLGRAGSFVDWGPVHLITTGTLRHLTGRAAGRRFRPNVVVADDGAYGEDAWVGRDVHVGSAVLRVLLPTPRCVVPTLAEPGSHDDPSVLRRLASEHRVPVGTYGKYACAGVYADVVQPGLVSVGDTVTVVDC
jgi:uncharacterized protein YcbX